MLGSRSRGKIEEEIEVGGPKRGAVKDDFPSRVSDLGRA